MTTDSQEESDNILAEALWLEGVAAFIAQVPTYMARLYANGGPGVSEAVVGDRFKGAGNARFVPLSPAYALWKSQRAKSLSNLARKDYGQGSKLLKVKIPNSRGGFHGGPKGVSNLPILVLTGALRAAIVKRKHAITQEHDTAWIDFSELPDYSEFLHTGTSRMPKRSPVEPNTDDIARIQVFTEQEINARVGSGALSTKYGAGIPRVF